MRTFISFFTLLVMGHIATSQIHEAGILAGGSNYIGDIGATNYVSPNNIALGVIYKWNISSRYSYRASFMYARIQGMDSKSDIPSRQNRNYTFKNNIREVSLGMEFNFLDFDLHRFGLTITPYVHSGLSYFNYDASYFDTDEALKYDTNYSFAIPITLGIKGRVFDQIVVGLEINTRYTFTDNLDGSNSSDGEFNGFGFGNLNSNDWYVFSGITVTYTFGRNPCYCK